MKKLFSLLALTVFVLGSSFAQRGGITWFDVGLKVQTGASGLYNTEVVNNSNYNYDIALFNSSSIGGKIGINYDAHGLAIDLMYGGGKQPFEGPGIDSTSQSIISTSWKKFDIYTLYRHNANAGYFEIGPKFSFFNKVDLTEDLVGSTVSTTEVTDSYSSNGLAGVIGFGAYLMGNDGAFSGVLGMRFEYGLSNFVNSDGETAGAPVNNTGNFDNMGATTAPVFAGIVFELNWGLGYFGKASCGGRSKFIRF